MASPILPFPTLCRAEPIGTQVVYFAVGGKEATAIARQWPEKGRVSCGGLCDPARCTFRDGACLVGVMGRIPADQCPSYAAV